ncbi:hypothetical protein DFH28DRAFT_879893 [Melampsora americana]|nr:hypothetical protein DFH28DRAFT_879893 [Melampsora americana]
MIPSERKKKHKRPVIIDLASDSSTEDIDPELIIDNQETCNSETPAKHEAPRDNSSVNLPDTISLLNEKTRSEPASTDHNSSHLNLESLHLDLEPYDEAEDQSITPSHTQALSRFNSSSHDPNDKPGQEIQKQPVNIDKDHINLPTDIQNQSQTPSRTSTSSRTISLSLDRNLELSDLRLDYYEEMNPSETGRNEDRFLILTHLNEGSSVEELIRFVKTGEDLRKQPPKNEAVTESGPNKLPEPLKIWCDLASRGYPKSLWDFVPKSKRKYIGEKLNHGNLNQRFMIVEYQSRFQKELSYEFFKGGTNRSEILFYCGSVMVHLLDDLNDLEGCDCIYDRNPEIITCKIVREKFKRLIKTLILIGEERKRKDLKPVWQKLKKEIIEDKFKKCLNDEELMVENFDEYLKDASKVGIVRMSQVIVGKDLNQVDMLGLGEPIVHWQLMKPFRKSIEDTH